MDNNYMSSILHMTRQLQDEVPRCISFANDIVLIDETSEGLDRKLDRWQETNYLVCNFGLESQGRGNSIEIKGVKVPQCKAFRYLDL